MRNKAIKIGFIVFASLVVTVTFISLMVHIKFLNKKATTTFFNDSSNKMWAHHGFSKVGESYHKNNIELAFKQNVKGVELDLFYDKNINSFMVVHDESEKDTLILNQLLTEIKVKKKFWFDLKNLKKENTSEIISLLQSINQKHQLNNNFIVESKNAKELNKLTKAGIFTSLWITIAQNNNLLANTYARFKNKLKLVLYNFNAVSMPYYYYLREGEKMYSNFPIHTWVNRAEYDRNKEEILNDNKLKVVLFDRR